MSCKVEHLKIQNNKRQLLIEKKVKKESKKIVENCKHISTTLRLYTAAKFRPQQVIELLARLLISKQPIRRTL